MGDLEKLRTPKLKTPGTSPGTTRESRNPYGSSFKWLLLGGGGTVDRNDDRLFFFWFWLDREKRRKWIDVELKACTLPNSWKTIRIRTVFFGKAAMAGWFWGFQVDGTKWTNRNSGTFPGRFSLGLPLGWVSSCGWYFCLKLIFPIKKKEMGRRGVDGQRVFGSWCMNFFSPVKKKMAGWKNGPFDWAVRF